MNGLAIEELVERIVRGDRDAESELIERFARGVRMIVSRGTRDRAAVDDLCQETLRIAIEKIRAGDVRDARRLPGFICAIARNLAIDHARRARRAAPAAIADGPDHAPTALDRLLMEERAAAVRQVLAELGSDRDREILFRFYVAEEPKDEICKDLGLTSLHFNRVLFRARERYRTLYEAKAAEIEKRA